MATISTSRTAGLGGRDDSYAAAPASGVAWAAIIGGAVAAAALSLLLMALGSGLGLASVSPWPNAGASATTFTVMTAIWLVIVHWLASGFGGYLTGRLRPKSIGLHGHEVFFRDTAHGLLTWATATVLAAAVFGSAATSLLAGGTKVATAVGAGAAQGAASSGNTADPSAYFVDMLYRSDRSPAAIPPNDQNVRGETARILASGLKAGEVPAADRTYVAQLVAARTGLSQTEAEGRVNAVIDQAKAAETKAREAADKARKAGAYLSLFTALAMLIGAFIASVAGALGGGQRDEWTDRLAAGRL